jgi:hypothetical protein
MKPIEKVLAGDKFRKTRLHDMKGNKVGVVDASLNLPRSVVSYLAEQLFGLTSATPWIPYSARRAISKALPPNCRAIEFGSGMSTLWLAPRCGSLHSIEHDPSWYQAVSSRLLSLKNIRYEHRQQSAYTDVLEYPNGSLDFAFIDGIQRADCVRAVIPKLRPGGWLYLDNSDAEPSAEYQVLEALTLRNGTKRYFTDFCPRLLHPNEGLLVNFED